jgi:Fe-S cluster assembly iron-binding protein IscA
MQLKLEVTEEARSQVRELIKSQKPGTAVRVYAQAGGGGGCGCGDGGCGGGAEAKPSGPTFGLAFDKPRTGDVVVPVDGFQVVVDAASAPELEGAKIDFVPELDTSGFTILPANATLTPREAVGGGCGCGAGGGGCC